MDQPEPDKSVRMVGSSGSTI